MKGHLYPFTKSGRWRQLPSRIAGSTAGGGRYFRSTLHLHFNGRTAWSSIPQERKYRQGGRYFRYTGSSDGTSGSTSGKKQEHTSTGSGVHRNWLRKWAPEVIAGSTAECTGTSGLPEVPVLLPVQLPGHSSTGSGVHRNWLRKCHR